MEFEDVVSCSTSDDSYEARDSEWQWNQLGHMQICTSPQTDNHTSIPPLSFLQDGCVCYVPVNLDDVKLMEYLLSIYFVYTYDWL